MIIAMDDLKFPVDSLNVNRIPRFTMYWDASEKRINNVIHSRKWDYSDPNVDYFQVTFSTYNFKSLVLKLLNYFKDTKIFKIITPKIGFQDSLIQRLDINDNRVTVSLITKTPISGSMDLKSNVCLAIESNYRNSQPGFVQLFQFGNYLVLSTYPFKISCRIEDGTPIFSNDYYTIYRLPISNAPKIIPYYVGGIKCYCYTNLPPLMTDLIIEPVDGMRYHYVFGVHPSCSLPAYLKVQDLNTGEVWYNTGNNGVITLAPGVFKLTPVVIFPEKEPIEITGNTQIIDVSSEQKVLEFLSPVNIFESQHLKIKAYENIVLYFNGWKTFDVESGQTIDIEFDYPGTYRCQVFSKDRNIQVTTFNVNVYGDVIDIDENSTTVNKTTLYNNVIDVVFHDIPVVDKPVLVSIDGKYDSITFEDADVVKLNKALYKVTYKEPGLKKITITKDGNEIIKYVNVNPGFKKLITVVDGYKCKCTTNDFTAIIQSPSTVKVISPNSSYEWIEYSVGPTNINVQIVKGEDLASVQYNLNVYNKDALKIVSYSRSLYLLHPPNAMFDYVDWYLNDKYYIGTGTSIQIPPNVSPGPYKVTAKIKSYETTITISDYVIIPKNTANQIQLENQIINPLRSTRFGATNNLVTIINDKPEVSFEYIDLSLSLKLTKYIYLDQNQVQPTFIGVIDDLVW